MSEVEDKYQYTTAEENIIMKDWAAGSSQQFDVNEFIIKKVGSVLVGSYEKVRYSPAWWKILDEAIVNILDHLVRCLGTQKPVTRVKISFDKNGRFRAYNNGPGIEVAIHKVASEKLGRETWVPSFIFGTLFQGSNRNRNPDSIIGGTNGLGAKLSNCFSSDFVVETVDGERGLYFLQKWKNHMQIVEKPVIIDLKQVNSIPVDRREPHTTLAFAPDYTGLFGYDKFDESVYNKLVDVVRTRVIFASAYAHYTVNMSGTNQPFEIYFNDEIINVKSIADIARILFPNRTQITTNVVPVLDPSKPSRLPYKYTWEVCAVLMNTSSTDVKQLSNVNGVVVREGKHTKRITDLICDGVKEKIGKIFNDKNLKFSPTYVSGNVFLFVNAKIPNPSWTGQRKDILDLNIGKLAGYNLDTKFINTISEKLRDQIVDSIFSTDMKSGTKKKSKQTEYEKYTPAKKCNSKSRLKCTLIPVEGDSAKASVEIGITKNLGFDYYGVISLGGVIMNARKECVVAETSNGRYIKKSTKLTNNIFLNVLMEVTGLNTAYKYDPNSPTYKKEMSELHYGCIAACVDQDLDGKGNILGLLLSTGELFWPNLVRAGYFKWFCTPIIRAYPKSSGKVVPFFSTLEYEKWASVNNTAQFDIMYYKGLATHGRDEIAHMFKDFHKSLFTYYIDERSHELFEIYFGNSPDLRKRELSQPTKVMSKEKQHIIDTTRLISCSDHLEYETNLYQKDNLERKLDHVIDGQNQSGRKILDGILKGLPGKKALKVAQLGGYVAEHENYHHGEASLSDSITGKGLITTGGKQLPFIIPSPGNFGSRKEGGNDAGSPRYIFAKLNRKLTSLLFPDVDYHILPFNFDEGSRSEPKYFMPIIPLAVCESAELPAHGWKLKTWARDVFKVIDNVRRLIRIDDKADLLRLPVCVYKGAPYEWRGEIKTIRGDPFSFGKYTLDEAKNKLRITELPLRVWTTPYVNMLKKKAANEANEIILDVHPNKSDDISVDIEVTLKPGALTYLAECGDSFFTDGIEEFFQLRDRMDSHINLMGMSGEVIMFESYEAVIHHWFPVRKEFYAKRIERKRVLIELEIRMYENIIRYVENSVNMKLSKRKYAEMNQILADLKYDKIYRARINSPGFTPTEDLMRIVLESESANYDYLLDLSDRNKSEEALDKYINDLGKTRAELDKLNEIATKGRFPGAVIWESELDALEAVIREGLRTFWKFEDASKYIY